MTVHRFVSLNSFIHYRKQIKMEREEGTREWPIRLVEAIAKRQKPSQPIDIRTLSSFLLRQVKEEKAGGNEGYKREESSGKCVCVGYPQP